VATPSIREASDAMRAVAAARSDATFAAGDLAEARATAASHDPRSSFASDGARACGLAAEPPPAGAPVAGVASGDVAFEAGGVPASVTRAGCSMEVPPASVKRARPSSAHCPAARRGVSPTLFRFVARLYLSLFVVALPGVVLVFLVVFVSMTGFGLLIPVGPYFGLHLGASASEITYAFGAYSFGQLIAAPIWILTDSAIG
jgi:hypothetical protein